MYIKTLLHRESLLGCVVGRQELHMVLRYWSWWWRGGGGGTDDVGRWVPKKRVLCSVVFRTPLYLYFKKEIFLIIIKK